MKCHVCGGEKFVFLFNSKDYISGENFSIYKCSGYKCSGCGLVLTYPLFSFSELGKYYQGLYYGARKSFVENAINYSRLRKIFRLSGGKKVSVLDVGCGNGSFLRTVLEKGFDAYGTELAPESHFENNKLQPRICKKELPECGFEENKFDIITMWHTLEHFYNPLSYLLEVKRILKDDGVLIIEIPNFESWQSRIAKGDWFHLDVPRHLAHYAPKSISAFLNSAGFFVLKISHFSFIYGIFGFFQSIINIFTSRKNLFFDLLNGKITMKDFKNNMTIRDLVIAFVLAAPVFFIAIFAAIFESFFRRGGIITVYAMKNKNAQRIF